MPKQSAKQMHKAKRCACAAESDAARAAHLASDAVRRSNKRAKEAPQKQAECLARDATRNQEVHCARLRQVRYNNHNLACYDDTDFFQEELHGDYRQTLSKTTCFNV